MNLQSLEDLVPALLHTLWIGLLSATFLFIALRNISPSRVRLRYTLGILVLLAVLLGGLVMWEWTHEEPVDTTSIVLPSPDLAKPSSPSDTYPKLRSDQVAPGHSIRHTHNPSAPNWQRWAGICWMAGALLSLLRLFRLSRGVQRLVRQSRPVEHPVVDRLVAELSRTAGFTRRIVLLTGKHIVQPAVTGFFRPALFIPLSTLIGLPEWQLRAILAHELAHIVRHDFLVNALQLLTETILFFNPAVWWINRRIREEREACCDALAAEWIDSKTALAETLIDQASVQSGALPAFGGSDSGSLKNRILRLISPNLSSPLELPWKSLLLVILFAGGGLFLAQRGTAGVVSYIKRMNSLDTARQEFASPGHQVAQEESFAWDEITIDFTVTTDDGSALQLPIRFGFSGGENYSYWYRYFNDYEDITCVRSNLWSIQLKVQGRGMVSEYDMDGEHYARTKGPGAMPDRNGNVKLPLITLSKGFTGRIRFMDPNGKPVSGVKVSKSGDYEIISTSDEDGIATFSNIRDTEARIDVVPPDGFCCEDKIPVRFKKGEIFDCRLKTGMLFEGKILDSEGKAISNAKVSLRLPGPHQKFNCGYLPYVMSDDKGRFRMQWIDPDLKPTLFIEAAGYMGKWIAPSSSDDHEEHTYTMRPARKITMVLKNIGDRDGFLITGHFDEHRFQYFPSSHLRQVSKTRDEEIYELDLWETTYGFRAVWKNGLKRHIEFIAKFDGRNVSDTVELDIREILGEPVKAVPHQVRLKFLPPDGEPMPRGTIEIGVKIEAAVKYALPENGILESEIIMPPGTPLMVRAKHIKGYAIHQLVDPVSTNYIADCRLEPAGGIAIACFFADGAEATHYSVYTRTRSIADPDAWHSHPIIYTAPDEHTCMREMLELETKQHQIHITKHHPEADGGELHFTSDWITLTEDEPVQKLTCVLKPLE